MIRHAFPLYRLAGSLIFRNFIFVIEKLDDLNKQNKTKINLHLPTDKLAVNIMSERVGQKINC